MGLGPAEASLDEARGGAERFGTAPPSTARTLPCFCIFFADLFFPFFANIFLHLSFTQLDVRQKGDLGKKKGSGASSLALPPAIPWSATS